MPRQLQLSDRVWVQRINHILEAIERIEQYVADMDEDVFMEQTLVQDAVLPNFQVIGEAARHIPTDVQQAEHHIPWSSMQKMRHVIVYAYVRIDNYVIWQTIQEDLLPLIVPLQELLRKYGD